MRYLDSQYWKDIIQQNEIKQQNLTQTQKDYALKQAENTKNIENYLKTNRVFYIYMKSISFSQNDRPLAWNIAHSDKIY
jgi:hypothetical protein